MLVARLSRQAVTRYPIRFPPFPYVGLPTATMSTTPYSDLKASDEAHQMHGFGHPLMQKGPRQLVVFESGDGAVLKDVEGKEYLDAMAGITVAHLGHGRTDLARVAFEQVGARHS